MNDTFDRIVFEESVFEDVKVSLRKYLLAELYPGDVPVYRFDIFNRSGSNVGNIEFRAGNTDLILNSDGHIGYAILREYRGNNYAYKACKAIIPFIGQHKLKSLIITAHCDNQASNAIIKNLGAQFLTKNSAVDKNVYQITLSD